MKQLDATQNGEPTAAARNFEGAHGHAMQVLTPAEAAQVSGGVWLLYWLLTQPAY